MNEEQAREWNRLADLERAESRDGKTGFERFMERHDAHQRFSLARRAGIIAAITELYGQGRENFWASAEHLSEALCDYPSMDMLSPDEIRARLEELIP